MSLKPSAALFDQRLVTQAHRRHWLTEALRSFVLPRLGARSQGYEAHPMSANVQRNRTWAAAFSRHAFARHAQISLPVNKPRIAISVASRCADACEALVEEPQVPLSLLQVPAQLLLQNGICGWHDRPRRANG